MAAVELKALLRSVVADLPHVAVDTALVALGQVVDGPAEGGMSAEQVDVPALWVQDVGGQAGENFQIGNQLAQLLLIKEYVHTNTSHWKKYPLRPGPGRRDMGAPP